jgi:hypothetical protein
MSERNWGEQVDIRCVAHLTCNYATLVTEHVIWYLEWLETAKIRQGYHCGDWELAGK